MYICIDTFLCVVHIHNKNIYTKVVRKDRKSIQIIATWDHRGKSHAKWSIIDEKHT